MDFSEGNHPVLSVQDSLYGVGTNPTPSWGGPMDHPQPIRALPFLDTVIGSGMAHDPIRSNEILLGLLFFPLDLNPKGGKAILLQNGKAILKMGPNYRVKRR